jgi:hypothetical protein
VVLGLIYIDTQLLVTLWAYGLCFTTVTIVQIDLHFVSCQPPQVDVLSHDFQLRGFSLVCHDVF